MSPGDLCYMSFSISICSLPPSYPNDKQNTKVRWNAFAFHSGYQDNSPKLQTLIFSSLLTSKSVNFDLLIKKIIHRLTPEVKWHLVHLTLFVLNSRHFSHTSAICFQVSFHPTITPRARCNNTIKHNYVHQPLQ